MFYRRDPEVDAAARVHPPLLGNAPAPLRFIMTRCACRTESKPVPSLFRGSTSQSFGTYSILCYRRGKLYTLQCFPVHHRSIVVTIALAVSGTARLCYFQMLMLMLLLSHTGCKQSDRAIPSAQSARILPSSHSHFPSPCDS